MTTEELAMQLHTDMGQPCTLRQTYLQYEALWHRAVFEAAGTNRTPQEIYEQLLTESKERNHDNVNA